jgi:regulatory protein
MRQSRARLFAAVQLPPHIADTFRVKSVNANEVRALAVAMLARREHGVQELCKKLIRKGSPPVVAQDVVAGLAAQQLVSDRRFTDDLARVRRNRGYGPVRIERELRAKAVAPDVVDQWRERAGEDWIELLREVRRKKYGTRLPQTFAERAKQARFLFVRGFTHEQIRLVLGQRDED